MVSDISRPRVPLDGRRRDRLRRHAYRERWGYVSAPPDRGAAGYRPSRHRPVGPAMRSQRSRFCPYEPTCRAARGALTVGDVIPEFRLPALAAVIGNAWEFDSAWVAGAWVALLYWPKHSGPGIAGGNDRAGAPWPAFRRTRHASSSWPAAADRPEGTGPRPSQRRFTSDLPVPRAPRRGGRAGGPARSRPWPWAGPPRARDLRGRSRGCDPLDERERAPRRPHPPRRGRGPRRLAGAAPPQTDASGRPLIRSCAWCCRLQTKAAGTRRRPTSGGAAERS
jgi:hypothetical protein